MGNKFETLKYNVVKLRDGLEVSYHANQGNKYKILGDNNKSNLHFNLSMDLAKNWDFNYPEANSPLDFEVKASILDPVDSDLSSYLYYTYDKANLIVEMLELQNKATEQINLANESDSIFLKSKYLSNSHSYNSDALDKSINCLENYKQKTELDSLIAEATKEVHHEFANSLPLAEKIEVELQGLINSNNFIDA